MTSKKKTKFSGDLAKPRQPPRLSIWALFAPDDKVKNQVEKLARREIEQEGRLLYNLCKHYGIDVNAPFCWLELSLCLAREFVPGFQMMKEHPGAPTTWGVIEGSTLVLAVEDMIQPGERNKGVAWAVRQLVNREPWKTLVSNGNTKPEETLRQIYYRYVKHKVVPVMRDVRAYDELMYGELVKDPKGFYSMVRDLGLARHITGPKKTV